MKIDWQLKSFEELSKKELYKLLQLRTEVFVVEQNCPYQECDGKDIEAWHLLGKINNELVAYMRILEKGIIYPEMAMGRIVTSPKHRKKGIGRELMNKSLQIVKDNFKEQPIRISAQTYLLKFYSDFGFKSTGKDYLEDGIPHSEMVRK